MRTGEPPASTPNTLTPPVEPAVIDGTSGLIQPAALIYLVAAVTAWAVGLSIFPYAAGAYAIVISVASVVANRGHIVVGPGGITVHGMFRHTHVDWNDVWSLSIEGGFTHRFVRLRRRSGRPIALPALRAPRFAQSGEFDEKVALLDQWTRNHAATFGVAQPHRFRTWRFAALTAVALAALIGADRPWFWVAGPEATTAPDPCPALAGALDVRDYAGPAESMVLSDGAGVRRACEWHRGSARAHLEIFQYSRHGLMSGTGVAWEAYRELALMLPSRPIDIANYPPDAYRRVDLGFGDEGTVVVFDATTLIARRANVVVWLSVKAGDQDPLPLTDLTGVARNVIGQLGLP